VLGLLLQMAAHIGTAVDNAKRELLALDQEIKADTAGRAEYNAILERAQAKRDALLARIKENQTFADQFDKDIGCVLRVRPASWGFLAPPPRRVYGRRAFDASPLRRGRALRAVRSMPTSSAWWQRLASCTGMPRRSTQPGWSCCVETSVITRRTADGTTRSPPRLGSRNRTCCVYTR
jgi:hypothetical protein